MFSLTIYSIIADPAFLFHITEFVRERLWPCIWWNW